MSAADLPAARMTLTVRGADATRDLAPLVQRIAFTDNDHGEADELEIVLADDGRFRDGGWRIGRTARIAFSLRYGGGPALEPRPFEIDRETFRRPPAVYEARALSAPLSKPLRSKRTRQYDNTTLARIAGDIASRSGLTLGGDPDAIPIVRATQHDETGLAFLAKLAEDYGHALKLDPDAIWLHPLPLLDGLPTALTLGPADIRSLAIEDSTTAAYSAAVAEWTDPESGETRRAVASDETAPGSDFLRLHIEAESDRDAALKAEAALYRANRAAVRKGRVELAGDRRLVAGVTLALAGFGRNLDGRFKAARATHVLAPERGWTVRLDLEQPRSGSAP